LFFIYNENYTYYPLTGIILGDLTNPLMHCKAILNKIGFVHTKLSVLIEKIYLSSYIFLRTVGFLTFCFIPGMLDTKLHLFAKLIMIGFMAFNIFIIKSMLGIIKSRKEKER